MAVNISWHLFPGAISEYECILAATRFPSLLSFSSFCSLPLLPLPSMQKNQTSQTAVKEWSGPRDPLTWLIRKLQPSGTPQFAPAGNSKLVHWGLNLLDINGERQNKNHRQKTDLQIHKRTEKYFKAAFSFFLNIEGFAVKKLLGETINYLF